MKIIFFISLFICILFSVANATEIYTVKKGETLWSIAKKTMGKGSKWPELAKLNKISGTKIKRGWKLIIPAISANKEEAQKEVEELSIDPQQKEEKMIVEEKKESSFQEKQDLNLVPTAVPQTVESVQKIQEQKEEKTSFNMHDFYIGGGAYKGENRKHTGQFGWAKARYRPVDVQLNEDLKGSVGIFGFFAGGKGRDEGYGYNWNRYLIGPTLKLIAPNSDYDIDLGIGQQKNKGSIDLYRSKQTDTILGLSIHRNEYERRNNGEVWFPKTELNFEAIVPLSSRKSHSWAGEPLPVDKREAKKENLSFGLIKTFYIYDHRPNENMIVSPTFNLGASYERARDWSMELGPGAVVTSHGYDIIHVSFLNYKKSFSGRDNQWMLINGSIDIYGLYRSFKASKIKEATEDDVVRILKK